MSAGLALATKAATIAMLSQVRGHLAKLAKIGPAGRQAQGLTLFPDYGQSSPHLHRRHLHSAPLALLGGMAEWLKGAGIKFEESLSRASHVADDGFHTELSTMRGGKPPLEPTRQMPTLREALLPISRPCCANCEEALASDEEHNIVAPVGLGNLYPLWVSW